jgi:uncharacterized protein YjiS (DUF1127 family)
MEKIMRMDGEERAFTTIAAAQQCAWHRLTLASMAAPIRALLKAVRFLSSRYEYARQRRALAALDDHLLRDIGLTRHEAAREAHKPFWR